MAEFLIIYLSKQLASFGAKQLASFAAKQIRLVVGVDEEVRKMEDNLRTVTAELNDAEKRQVTEAAVKLWLKRLVDVSYEIDDVLDEWNTAMIKADIEKKKEEEEAENNLLAKKVCSFIASLLCCFRQIDELLLRRKIASKIKDLNGKLDAIVSEKGSYGFELRELRAAIVSERGLYGSELRGPGHELDKRLETSGIDESKIQGRTEVKVDLVEILLGKKGSEEERNPYVISLVGMGGIGKTTLAQLAYNDPEVKSHFEKRIWVCVSEPFDQCRVAKAILGGGHTNSTELQSLLEKIGEKVGGKRFFLVLDDVWSEDDKKWERFKNALKYGAPGSRILVTTRKHRVADIMGSTSACKIIVGVLSDEDCWLVFSKIAFLNRDREQCKQLEVLGRKIAKKCKGWPLAANTLGSLMRFKSSSTEDWEEVLDSNLWELEDDEKRVEKDLFAPLLLSYNDLPSPLKQCFSFCAIFPKDYAFYIDDLVFMWMAHGYIDLEKDSKKKKEIIGRKYFKNLASRFFFQDYETYEDGGGKIITYKMHDIIHDFAQLITKNECFTINSVAELKSDYGSARHLHLGILERAEFPGSVYSAENLRTLILDVPRDYDLSSLFQHFKCLRTLTLNFLHAKSKELPDAVDTFIHLRYLSILNYHADRLPETICNLCNLQILKITVSRGDKLVSLPQGMNKLINLRHLSLGRTY